MDKDKDDFKRRKRCGNDKYYLWDELFNSRGSLRITEFI